MKKKKCDYCERDIVESLLFHLYAEERHLIEDRKMLYWFDTIIRKRHARGHLLLCGQCYHSIMNAGMKYKTHGGRLSYDAETPIRLWI